MTIDEIKKALVVVRDTCDALDGDCHDCMFYNEKTHYCRLCTRSARVWDIDDWEGCKNAVD